MRKEPLAPGVPQKRCPPPPALLGHSITRLVFPSTRHPEDRGRTHTGLVMIGTKPAHAVAAHRATEEEGVMIHVGLTGNGGLI